MPRAKGMYCNKWARLCAIFTWNAVSAMWGWFPVHTAQAQRVVLVFCFEKLLTSCTTLWNVPIRDIFRPRGQVKMTSRCVHVLGFVNGKQEEMPASVVVPSSCHSARATTSLCSVCCRKILPKMTSSLSLVYFSHVEKFSYSFKMHYFINYFYLTFHHVRLTNNSGMSLRSTDWKSTLSTVWGF